jgi:hypothetical protein
MGPQAGGLCHSRPPALILKRDPKFEKIWLAFRPSLADDARAERAQPQHQKLSSSRPVIRPTEAHSADGGQGKSRENNFLRACDFLSPSTLTIGSSISAAVPFAPVTEATAREPEADPHRPVGDYTAPPAPPRETAGCLDAHRSTCDCHLTGRLEMKRILSFAAMFLWLSSATLAQTFNSGSTGADGVLDLTAGDREVQLPESGILNYTTVNIPTGRTLRFKKNSRNTPVTLLAQGDIIISGTIDTSAQHSSSRDAPGIPGPGGFPGAPCHSIKGFGPGGGEESQASGYFGSGRWVGPVSLVPLIGGSGAASGNCPFGTAGGGGGGAILIASSSAIRLTNGLIAADGKGALEGQAYGTGSGGAIRMVANSITVDKNSTLSARGTGGCSANIPCHGIIRLETPAGALFLEGSVNPRPILSTINPVLERVLKGLGRFW